MPGHFPPTGLLWDRIGVNRKTEAADGQGGRVITYPNIATFPGRLRETLGSQFSEAEGRMISWSGAAAWLDIRSARANAPKPGDQLTYGAKTFEVLNASEMEGLVDCDLREVVP